MKFLLILSSLFVLHLNIMAQSFDPKFAPFKGSVIEMPEKWRSKGYAPFMEELPVIQELEWKELRVKDRPTEEAFKDVNAPYSFGVIFRTTMKIDTPAYYYFNLISDDGSRLWINDIEVINNDGDHKMQLVSDTVALDKGFYDIKVWYYQAFALRYGLMFESGFTRFIDKEATFLQAELKESSIKLIFFNHNSSAVSADAESALVDFVKEIDWSSVKSIEIIGSANSIGNDDYNLRLSKKRAKSVASVVKNDTDFTNIIVNGIGELSDSHLNDDEELQAQSRKVEIKVNY